MSNELIALMGSTLIVSLGIFLVTFVLEFNKRQKWHYKEKELMNAQFEQALLQSRLEIQEQTFKQISQEIHDNIGQVLTLVKLQINTLEGVDDVNKSKMMTANDMLTKAIQDLRDLSKTLNSDTIAKVGLIKAIEMELELVKKVCRIETSMNFDAAIDDKGPGIELILFRIIQEAIHNVIKHAAASRLQVDGIMDNAVVQLTISDNGKGFKYGEPHHEGNGLLNMKHRCNLIGASLDVHSSENKGTMVTISFKARK